MDIHEALTAEVADHVPAKENGNLLPKRDALAVEDDDALPPEENGCLPAEDDTLPLEEEDTLPVPLVADPVGSFDLTFDGINVVFPYEPYESQKDTMEYMIKAMNSSENCFLESPTGTGKTAALLCASLAWLKSELETSPKSTARVIYASRTHSQLQQVADQLKKTAYSDIPMVILASRNQTCINDVARKSDAVDDMCELMRANYSDLKNRGYAAESNKPICSFYKNFRDNGAKFQQSLKAQADGTPTSSSSASCMQPWDIEDVINFGLEHNTCPYYEIHDMNNEARLVLCTYNHLLHPRIRNAVKLEVKGSVVIFDQAHNIESTCMEIASRRISMRKLQKTVIPALNEARRRCDIPEQKREPLQNIEAAFTTLTNWLSGQEDPENGSEYEWIGHAKVSRIADPVEKFSSIGFSPDNVNNLYRDLLILKDEYLGFDYDPVIAQFKLDASVIHYISSVLLTFQILFEKDPATGDYKRLEHYSVDVAITPAPEPQPSEIELSVLCLSPHVVFEAMESARSVIVTSGTLSPVESFSSELRLSFSHVLKAAHVVGRDRLFATVISNHEEKDFSFGFQFDYKSLSDTFENQAKALANLLLRVCDKIPNGILVFFPSKPLTLRFKTKWETDGTLKRLSALKLPFFEHDIAPTEFKQKISEYRSQATSDGAIMFAFLRGRISEGIDFPDDQARAVITVGIPFGPIKDLKVRRKREYNDDMQMKYGDKAHISGWDWYRINAFLAMNQGLGRCIRHKEDWGVVLMVDRRCHRREYEESISAWVQKCVRHGCNFDQIEEDLSQFLQRLQVSISTPVKKMRLNDGDSG